MPNRLLLALLCCSWLPASRRTCRWFFKDCVPADAILGLVKNAQAAK